MILVYHIFGDLGHKFYVLNMENPTKSISGGIRGFGIYAKWQRDNAEYLKG